MTHETMTLPAAPLLPEDDPGQNNLNNLLPLTGVLGSMAMVVGMGPGGSGVRGLMMVGALLISTGAVVMAQIVRQRLQRRRTVERAREEHLHRLGSVANLLRQRASEHRTLEQTRWPDPTRARPTHPDSAPGELLVRLGTAEVELDVSLESEAPGPGVGDPVCVEALERFPDAHSHIGGMPFTLALHRLHRITFVGNPDRLEDAGRALLLACAVAHRPEQVGIGVLCAPDELARWDWTKWLGHTAGRLAGPEAPRLVDHRASHLLARVRVDQHLVLLTTQAWARIHPELPAAELPEHHTVVALRAESRTSVLPEDSVRIELPDGSRRALLDPAPVRARNVLPDRCSLAEATAAARRLAAWPSSARIRQDASALWDASPAPRQGGDLLRVPIGTDRHGSVVHLDLKEAAHGGHGPHGLLVGATGSGKSELLRSLVTALVSTHVPEDLALVLVDFKGGATFSEVADLPHVAACVTNLADDASLVDRMQDALAGELERRQEVLHAHGHASISEHRAARAAGEPLEPMPHLFVCVDEFSELLAARPEFVDLFTAIGRLGRSLGLHLLLASQRLDDGRLHALEAHLSYRIALRTFSAQESRTVIGTPEAHTLPRRPGVGLVRTGADDLVRFEAHHLGAPAPGVTPTSDVLARPILFTAAGRRSRPALSPSHTPTPQRIGTVGDLVLARLRGAAAGLTATRQVWLPPLGATIALGDLLGPLETCPERGLHAPHWRPRGAPRLPLGLVDLPRQQRHEVLGVTLEGACGHVAVAGSPRSGRSTTIQTLTCALALTHTPTELHVHLIDLAGGALAPLAALPHVVSHVSRGQNSLLERVVTEAESVVAEREEHTDDDAPRVVVVVDGWGTLRSDHDDLEGRLVALAPRALAVGVHLVVTALRWSELRAAFLDTVASRVELRLGDPFDSLVDRRAAAQVPLDRPGRGIVAGPHAMVVAHPGLLPGPSPRNGCTATVAAVAAAWTGPTPARWADLPREVTPAMLDSPAPGRVRIGLDERGLTCTLPATDHVVIAGTDASGRTTALRNGLTEWLGATAGQIVLLDPRGSLEGVVPAANLLAHVTGDGASQVLRSLADTLARRVDGRAGPGPHVPVTLAVDDLDLLRDLGVDLTVLTPLLPRATAVGLRLMLACRTGNGRGLDRLAELLGDLGATRLELVGHTPGRAQLRGRTGSRTLVQTTGPRPPLPREELPC